MPQVVLPLAQHMQSVRTYRARMVMRVLTSQTFAASREALRAVVQDRESPQRFADVFTRIGSRQRPIVLFEVPVPLTISNGLDENEVSPAASVLAEALLAQLQADVVCIDAGEVACPFYAPILDVHGVEAIVPDQELFSIMVSGKELHDLSTQLVYASTVFEYDRGEPLLRYPAFSGVSLHLNRHFLISRMTTEGHTEVDPDGEYMVCVSPKIRHALVFMKAVAPERFIRLEQGMRDVFIKYLRAKKALPSPSRYFIPDWTNIDS